MPISVSIESIERKKEEIFGSNDNRDWRKAGLGHFTDLRYGEIFPFGSVVDKQNSRAIKHSKNAVGLLKRHGFKIDKENGLVTPDGIEIKTDDERVSYVHIQHRKNFDGRSGIILTVFPRPKEVIYELNPERKPFHEFCGKPGEDSYALLYPEQLEVRMYIFDGLKTRPIEPRSYIQMMAKKEIVEESLKEIKRFGIRAKLI